MCTGFKFNWLKYSVILYLWLKCYLLMTASVVGLSSENPSSICLLFFIPIGMLGMLHIPLSINSLHFVTYSSFEQRWPGPGSIFIITAALIFHSSWSHTVYFWAWIFSEMIAVLIYRTSPPPLHPPFHSNLWKSTAQFWINLIVWFQIRSNIKTYNRQ